MNNKELQAIRKLLMLDVSEAAELIGKVAPRSWQYWEAGRSPVPADVECEMQDLLAIRTQMMDAVDDKIAAGEALKLPFYGSFEQYQLDNPEGTHLSWRLSQSVAALYYAEGHADLV